MNIPTLNGAFSGREGSFGWEAKLGLGLSKADDTDNDGYSVVGSLIGSKTTTNLASDGESYLGIAKKAATANSEAQIITFGGVDSQQSGLTAGQKYFVQSDGSLATSADSSGAGSGTTMAAGKALSATKLLISE